MGAKPETHVYELSSTQLAREGFRLGVIHELFAMGRIDEATRLRLELALQEALANGFEHGNLELRSCWKEEFEESGDDRFSVMKRARLNDAVYAGRKVFVRAELSADELRISIRDEGKGFCAPERTDPEALHPYGRGLQMISKAVDEILFNDGGREIVMVKRIPPA